MSDMRGELASFSPTPNRLERMRGLLHTQHGQILMLRLHILLQAFLRMYFRCRRSQVHRSSILAMCSIATKSNFHWSTFMFMSPDSMFH
jgi:hypothetical protein